MPSSLTPQEFVAKWRHMELKERSAYQQHFLDVCRLIGHQSPAEIDSSGAFFTFEAGASKTSGGQGFADVWFKGHFAWEYKGKHANLDKAYQQLLQYREALFNPPLLVVCDLDQIVIHTNFTNTAKRIYALTLDDLLKPEKLDLLRRVFKDPEALKAPETTEQVTQQAAAHFSRLAEILRNYGEDPTKVAHFLIQLLFCLFAEDVGLLPSRLFTRLIDNGRRNSAAFAAQLRQLFAAMSTGGWFGPEAIPHFDGRLFESDVALELDSDGIATVAEVAALDWSSIEPVVFGTLFERSLDPGKRAQLGAHFTGIEDILLIVEPVLMAPLRRRWAEVQAQARQLAGRRDQAKGAARSKLDSEISALLIGFAGEIASLQILDPACGSGNFLYVALRLLLDLWKAISIFSTELGLPQFMPLMVPTPSPDQLHGIEINEYAHQLAQATIWIGYLQWMRENGYGFREPILRPLNNILMMDAILAYDAQGKPVEPEWPRAEVIIGNPPFLGSQRMRSELGDQYVQDLRTLYSDRLPACDLVCYWFETVRALIAADITKRAGLLATQAIRAGSNRQVLERIKATGEIFYAQADRPWVLDGAAVRVSMVGFDNGVETHRLLNESKDMPSSLAIQNAHLVNSINADLTSDVDLTTAHILMENSQICFQGPVKVGSFELENDVASVMLRSQNPNNRPNTEVIKPWMNASDVTGRSRNMWIIDFGEMSLEDAALYEQPFEYVKRNVKPFRDQNNDRQRRTFWWRLGRSGGDFRKAKENKLRIIVTPRVAKHRIFIWSGSDLVPDSRLFAFARDDDYFMGVLHSRIHEAWSLATSSRHGVGNDPTYNNTTCFETFPFPWPPGKEAQDDPLVQAIAQAARELVQLRDNWLNPLGASDADLKELTLTKLYNKPPTWLEFAHRKLDQAVFAAYGWPADLRDEEILEKLLALNLERSQPHT